MHKPRHIKQYQVKHTANGRVRFNLDGSTHYLLRELLADWANGPAPEQLASLEDVYIESGRHLAKELVTRRLAGGSRRPDLDSRSGQTFSQLLLARSLLLERTDSGGGSMRLVGRWVGAVLATGLLVTVACGGNDVQPGGSPGSGTGSGGGLGASGAGFDSGATDCGSGCGFDPSLGREN